MFFLTDKIGSAYNSVIEWRDPRVIHFPLLQSPIPAAIIFVSYLLIVLKIGPSFMENREPYSLRKTIIGYNIAQIIFNCIGIFWGMTFIPEVNILCTTVDKPNLINMHYGYFILKIIDLIETIFFVLRKKFNQITFLHLYHHAGMFLGAWGTCQYFPGGQVFFLGFINVIVHAVMYVYYLLTAWDARYKNKLWWKKHLTEMQIVQHCMVFVTLVVPLFNENCDYPKPVLSAGVPAILLMIYLFADFYRKAYLQKEPQKKE